MSLPILVTNIVQLAELRTDPNKMPVNSVDTTVLQGLLGGLAGANAAEKKAKLEAAAKTANNISGLVKAKKKDKAAAGSSDTGGSKRKLDADEEGSNGKRAKTEDLA
jgi:HAT1-interacting factor 1